MDVNCGDVMNSAVTVEQKRGNCRDRMRIASDEKSESEAFCIVGPAPCIVVPAATSIFCMQDFLFVVVALLLDLEKQDV
jgi:hypothetical protein